MKWIIGKAWTNSGVAVGGVLKEPPPSAAKKRPPTVVVEMACTGTNHLTVAGNAAAVPLVAVTVSVPVLTPV